MQSEYSKKLDKENEVLDKKDQDAIVDEIFDHHERFMAEYFSEEMLPIFFEKCFSLDNPKDFSEDERFKKLDFRQQI